MSKRLVNLGPLKRLLNIGSHGRKAPSSPSAAPVFPTSSRSGRLGPQVMVKVTGGSGNLAGVRAHLNYIGREGRGTIEADDGRAIRVKGFEK